MTALPTQPVPAGADLAPGHLAAILVAVHAALGPRHRVVSIAADEADPAHLPVILAAVQVMFGSGVRFVSMHPGEHQPAWALEGRRQIFASHRVR